jgi:hypothetical protein
MRKNRNAFLLFAALLLMYGAVFGLRHWWLGRSRAVLLETSRAEYLHHDFIEIRLRTRDSALNERWRAEPPVVTVYRGSEPVNTVGGMRGVTLVPEPLGGWVGRWPCPWNSPTGEYSLRLSSSAAFAERLLSRSFRIAARKPAPLPSGFSVLTWESDLPLASLEVPAPDGTTKDWRGLLDWVEYVGADAFWMLGGRTPGDKPGEVWASHNMVLFPQVAAECRRRGIKFGLYAMCYLTMSREKVPGYEYAKDVRDGRIFETRAISLREGARARHVAELLKGFRDIPGVDFVGLDYIRNALGGVELVDDFFNEMPGLVRPQGWELFTSEERMVWFARKKGMRRDPHFIDAWQWWRAHRTARIVRGIKDEIGDRVPLWAFTLTWDKGWHHGQDPVMMNDAGVDADALMLYEADSEQFKAMLHDWSRYVKRSDVQLVVGDVIDWPLHQNHPDGPKDFYRRMARAIDGIYADGPARGVFFHDLARALYGRKGAWTTREWLDQAKAAAEHMRSVEGGK